MKGWFDAFRDGGGSTLYAESNRTAVSGDSAIILTALVFLTVLTGFLIIFPGVRSQRVTTFACVILSLLTGLAIMLGATGSNWQAGTVQINTFYRSFSAEMLQAELGAHIGLNHVNITLLASQEPQQHENINFNERFRWIKPSQMRNEYRAALVKGLPYPILTVAEYLSASSEGFSWGRKLRSAGYYTSIVIWSSLASWVLMNLLLLTVPRYGAYTMVLTGSLMCFACGLYSALRPSSDLSIRLEEAVLRIELDWQFYLVLLAGILCMALGLVASAVDLVYPHTFSTILEVDFGTPYDRHILIVESEESRKRPTLKIPKLEEPITAGIEATTKLIRRLSKRGRVDDGTSSDPRGGTDNTAFEMDQPKVPLHVAGRSDSKQSARSFGSAKSSNHLELPNASFDLPHPVSKKPAECVPDSRKASDASTMSSSSFPRASLGDGEQPSFSEQFKRLRRTESRRDSSQSSCSGSSSASCALLRHDLQRSSSNLLSVPTLPVDTCPSGGDELHPPLEKRDSRSSNIIVFHTQDARGQLTRRQSSDKASLDP